jgi:MFS family permease
MAITPQVSDHRLSAWEVLCQRGFRFYLAADTVSQTGSWVQLVALAWVTVRLTESGTALGWVTAAIFGPLLLLGPYTGALVDRCDNLRVLLTIQLTMATQSAMLGLLTLTDAVTTPVLFGLALWHGLVYAVEAPARQSFIAEVVSVDGLTSAVGLKSAATATARMLAPPIAGLLMTTVGVGWCFAIYTVACLVACVALATVGEDRHAKPAESRRVLDGLRCAWSTPDLRSPLVLTAVVATFGLNHQVIVPLLAERAFGGGEVVYTVLYAAVSAGSVCGALAISQVGVNDRGLGAAAVGFGAAAAAVAVAPTVPLAAAGGAIAGAAALGLVSGATALMQVRCDPPLRGQVMALAAMVVVGGMAAGGPLVGWVSEQFGPRLGLGVGAATALVAGGVVLVRSARRRGGAPGEPVGGPPTLR